MDQGAYRMKDSRRTSIMVRSLMDMPIDKVEVLSVISPRIVLVRQLLRKLNHDVHFSVVMSLTGYKDRDEFNLQLGDESIKLMIYLWDECRKEDLDLSEYVSRSIKDNYDRIGMETGCKIEIQERPWDIHVTRISSNDIEKPSWFDLP